MPLPPALLLYRQVPVIVDCDPEGSVTVQVTGSPVCQAYAKRCANVFGLENCHKMRNCSVVPT